MLPLQTLSNLLAALREGDYSIRARGASREEALGQVMMEANALGETLRSQRLGALERIKDRKIHTLPSAGPRIFRTRMRPCSPSESW